MSNVLIRDIPEEVLDRFKNMSKSHKMSLQQELRGVLERTVDQAPPDIFQKASDLRRRLRRKAFHFTDSAKLLREDRGR